MAENGGFDETLDVVVYYPYQTRYVVLLQVPRIPVVEHHT